MEWRDPKESYKINTFEEVSWNPFESYFVLHHADKGRTFPYPRNSVAIQVIFRCPTKLLDVPLELGYRFSNDKPFSLKPLDQES